jgi:hypothetical protein
MTKVYESLGQMMDACAVDAVRLARERYGFELDYSEESVAWIDTILTNVAADEPDILETETKRWGGYFGEVIRRRWDGEWSLEQYPGGNAALPAVIVRGSSLFPLMKVYRRLTIGEGESVGEFYAMVRKKLEAEPSAN